MRSRPLWDRKGWHTDGAANGDPCALRYVRNYSVELVAHHIIEEGVHAVRAGFGNCCRQVVRRFVIDGDVIAELFQTGLALFLRAGDTHRSTSTNLGELTDDEPDSASCRRNDHGLPRLGVTNTEQAHMGGHAVYAKHVQSHRDWRLGRIDFSVDIGSVRDRVGAPSLPTLHDLAYVVVRVI